MTTHDITLRAPEPGDTDIMYRWENDADQWDTSFNTAPLSRHQIAQYIEQYDADIYRMGSLRWIIECGGQPVGLLDVCDFDSRAMHAFIGIYVATQERRKGVASQALALACDALGQRLCMHSLAALVAVDNTASKNLFVKTGFKTAGCLQSWIRRGKSYHDVLLMQKFL